MKTILHMKKVIPFFILLLITSNSSNAQTLLDESFEGTSMPTGWTFQSTTSEPFYTWTFYDQYDDLEVAESNIAPQNEWVISPSYDLSTFSNIYLTFSPWMYFNREDMVADAFDFKVLISTDNGTSWTEIWNEDSLNTTNLDGTYFYDRTISKSLQSFSGAGMTNVKIGFQFISNGTSTNYNAIYLMDVKISTDCPITTLSNLSSTEISWFPIDNFTGTFDIEYGEIGFTQGTGTLINGLTTTAYSFPSNMCRYDVYIRTNCGGTTSNWSKQTFRNYIQDLFNSDTTSSSNQINWTGYSSHYDIEYGIGDFTLGTGTLLSNVPGFTYVLNDLSPDTNYKYFIRSNCDGIFGGWRSNTFTTMTLSLNEMEIKNNIRLYPNPTSNIINIEAEHIEIESIQLFDIEGRFISTNTKSLNKNIIDLSNFSTGIYIVKIKTKEGIQNIKIIKE